MERPKQRPSGRRVYASRVTPGSRSAAFHVVSGPDRRAQTQSSVVTPSLVKILVGERKSDRARVAEEGGSALKREKSKEKKRKAIQIK